MNQTLFDAARYIDEHGHAKGHYQDADGRVCLFGAVRMVMFGETSSICQGCYEYRLITKLVEDLSTKNGFQTAVSFNDALETTKEEVVKFLMEAAESE